MSQRSQWLKWHSIPYCNRKKLEMYISELQTIPIWAIMTGDTAARRWIVYKISLSHWSVWWIHAYISGLLYWQWGNCIIAKYQWSGPNNVGKIGWQLTITKQNNPKRKLCAQLGDYCTDIRPFQMMYSNKGKWFKLINNSRLYKEWMGKFYAIYCVLKWSVRSSANHVKYVIQLRDRYELRKMP